jgi:hypothetical protein
VNAAGRAQVIEKLDGDLPPALPEAVPREAKPAQAASVIQPGGAQGGEDEKLEL